MPALEPAYFAARRAQWEAKRKALAARPKRAIPQAAAGLAALFDLTGDPAFAQALAAMKAHGLDTAWDISEFTARASPDWMMALLLMDTRVRLPRALQADDPTAKPMSVRAAAAWAAAELGVAGASFRDVVDKLRLAYPAAVEQGFPTTDRNPGAIGKLFVVPLDGHTFLTNGTKIDHHPDHVKASALSKVPASGAEVVNNLHWRQAIARGEVSARVVGNL